MFLRVLYGIAGIDRQTLATCPATDKLWAAHLGFSLILSFTVVLGITFYATGYILTNIALRLLASCIVALTIFMFDRALFQSDWFYQGLPWQTETGTEQDRGRAWRRVLRIVMRLSISFGLAWVIAVFLELAIFSDTITDKIKRDHLAANQAVYERVDQYEKGLAAQIEQQRKELTALEALHRSDLAAPPPVPEVGDPGPLQSLRQQIEALNAQEAAWQQELREIEAKQTSYAQDMNAEALGQKLKPQSTGRAGAGPKYRFAKAQKDIYDAQRATREKEIAQLRVRREAIDNQLQRLLAEASNRREQARSAEQHRHDMLQAQVDGARAQLQRLESALLPSVAAFRQAAIQGSDFQRQRDDPLARMTAYQELKSDPRDGGTITLFSWMTKFLVIFLEIVPVVAKMFFSPPSVYALRIQAAVEQERRRSAATLAIATAFERSRQESQSAPVPAEATSEQAVVPPDGPPPLQGQADYPGSAIAARSARTAISPAERHQPAASQFVRPLKLEDPELPRVPALAASAEASRPESQVELLERQMDELMKLGPLTELADLALRREPPGGAAGHIPHDPADRRSNSLSDREAAALERHIVTEGASPKDSDADDPRLLSDLRFLLTEEKPLKV